MSARVLIVEDEAAIRLALSGLLRRQGYQVSQAESGEKAIAALQGELFDLVITDLALGAGPSGMDVLREARSLHPGLPVVMITAHGSVERAVEAMRNGAADFITKPFRMNQLIVRLENVCSIRNLREQNVRLQEQLERTRQQ